METERRFDPKSRQKDNLTFEGVIVSTNWDGKRTMSQHTYAESLEMIKKGCSFEVFKSSWYKSGWITNNRQDVAGDSTLLAQVTKESFQLAHIKQVNNTNKRIKEEKLELKVNKL